MKKIYISIAMVAFLLVIMGSASTYSILKSSTSLNNNQFETGTWETDTQPDTTGVIITEFMANPAVVSDSNGEWFEIYNPTDSPINLIGWRYRDNGIGNWTILASSINIFSHGYLVFVVDDNANNNGGISGGVKLNASFNLTNISDEIIIEKPDGLGGFVEVDRISYNKNSGYAISSGKSNKLLDLSLDNLLSTSWGQSIIQYGDGDYGTPGGPNV